MSKADIRARAGRLGGGGAPLAHGRLRHRLRLRRAHYLPHQFLSPYYNRRTRRVRRLAREPRPVLAGDAGAGARGGRRRLRDRLPARRSTARGPAGVELDEGLEFVRLADHLVDLWDVNVGSIAEWSKDSGAVALLRGGLAARVDRPRARGDGEADRRRRRGSRIPTGWPRSSLERRLGPDRRRAPVDRRPVPARARSRRAATTRSASASAATSASRRPTLAGHIGCTQNATAGRGVPPRLASGALRARPRTPTGTCSSSAPGRPGWSARSCSASGASGGSTSSTPSREIGGSMRWSPRLPGLGEWARRASTGGRSSFEAAPNVELITGRGWTPRTCATTAPTWSSSRPAPAGPATGSTASPASPIPGADAALPHVLTPEQVMLEGKRPPGRRVRRLRRRRLLRRRRAGRAAGARGHEFELVTPLHDRRAVPRRGRSKARRCGSGSHDLGMRLVPRHRSWCRSVETPASCEGTGERVRGSGERRVVLATRSALDDDLQRELRTSRGARAQRARGALRDRRLRRASPHRRRIFDGHRLAREIDSPNPARPLPFIRERHLHVTAPSVSPEHAPAFSGGIRGGSS